MLNRNKMEESSANKGFLIIILIISHHIFIEHITNCTVDDNSYLLEPIIQQIPRKMIIPKNSIELGRTLGQGMHCKNVIFE